MLDKILIKEVVAPIFIIIGGFLLNLLLRKLVRRALSTLDSKKNKTIIGLIYNTIKYFIIIIVLLMILDVFGVDTKTIIASLGIVGLAVGFALQDTLRDFLSGLAIIFDNQYVVGDYITIGGFKGEVTSLGLKTTKIKSANGEVKMIANRNITEVINHSIANSLAIVDLPFLKTLNHKEIEKVISKQCLELEKKIDGLRGPIINLGINNISLNTVEYRIIAETLPLKNFEVERIIKQSINEKLENIK